MIVQDFVEYQSKRIEYTIIRRNRKTVGINISREEGIRVSAPKWVSKKQIQEIVLEKASWIIKKTSELADKAIKIEFEEGAEWYFLGEKFYLRILEDMKVKKVNICCLSENIIITVPARLSPEEHKVKIQTALFKWYKDQAEKLIKLRLDIYSSQTGQKPESICIRQQKTRWGSCSSKKNVNFNWKLVMMPVSVIDYVIVHELSHLKVMNHSKDFWRVVESILPDYKLQKRVLKEYGKKINF